MLTGVEIAHGWLEGFMQVCSLHTLYLKLTLSQVQKALQYYPLIAFQHVEEPVSEVSIKSKDLPQPYSNAHKEPREIVTCNLACTVGICWQIMLHLLSLLHRLSSPPPSCDDSDIWTFFISRVGPRGISHFSPSRIAFWFTHWKAKKRNRLSDGWINLDGVN